MADEQKSEKQEERHQHRFVRKEKQKPRKERASVEKR